MVVDNARRTRLERHTNDHDSIYGEGRAPISLPSAQTYLLCCDHRRRGVCVLLLITHDGSPTSHGDVRRVSEPSFSRRSVGPAPVCYYFTAAPSKPPLEISVSGCNTNGSRASHQSRSIRKRTRRTRLTDSGELAG